MKDYRRYYTGSLREKRLRQVARLFGWSIPPWDMKLVGLVRTVYLRRLFGILAAFGIATLILVFLYGALTHPVLVAGLLAAAALAWVFGVVRRSPDRQSRRAAHSNRPGWFAGHAVHVLTWRAFGHGGFVWRDLPPSPAGLKDEILAALDKQAS